MATYSTVFYPSEVDGSAGTPVTWLDALLSCVSSYQGNLLFSYIVELLDQWLWKASVKLKAKRYTEKALKVPEAPVLFKSTLRQKIRKSF